MLFYFLLARKLAAFNHRGHLKNYMCSAFFVAINWGMFIWAVNNQHVLAASMGYFMAPIFYVMAGKFLLKETLTTPKLIAFILAVIGILPLAFSSDAATLLIASSIAISIVCYAYFRKRGGLPSFEGLLLETVLLVPVAALYLFLQNGSAFFCVGCSFNDQLLLITTGPVTLLPLLLFGFGVKSLPFSTMAFVQNINPSLQFMLGLLFFAEPLNGLKLFSFIFIWLGIAVLLGSEYKKFRAKPLNTPL